jgi:predicted methyltransferase
LCRDIEGEDEIASCREKYQAIGESDRMTLRFRKPIK